MANAGEATGSASIFESKPQPHIAPIYHRYIQPGQVSQPLTSRHKFVFGLSQLRSPYLLLTVATAAGYEHLVNGSPNYGTDSAAYGQRVGAAAIRDGSQTLFSDSIMASLLHEDPRYYIMGNRQSMVVRGGYAVSRVFVTRSDDGRNVPNYALLSGYAGAAALTNAYYPAPNQGASETFKSFAGSLAGVAISNSVREFLPDLLQAAHLRK